MDVFDLTLNMDYYVPLTKKEMVERLEYYKALTLSISKEINLKNKEYYELLDSLINLEISAFDINFPTHVMVPNILKDVLKYNVWALTQKTVDKFSKRDIVLIKEPEKHGLVKVYQSVIADLSLKPPYAFTQPSITINSYETDYDIVRQRMFELSEKYDRLKSEQREYRIEELYSEISLDENEDESEHVVEEDDELCLEHNENVQNKDLENNLEKYMKLCEDVEEIRKQLNIYRKCICLHKNSIYKEVSHALLEEYHIPHEEGNDLVKIQPWITIRKKSL